MAKVTTLDKLLWPLMEGTSVHSNRCVVCGRYSPLEQHHVVFRSQGRLFKEGIEIPKPTLTLCGFGNNLYDQNRLTYCHGKVHHKMLHFRWNDGWEWLTTSTPTKYEKALKLTGWRKINVSEKLYEYELNFKFTRSRLANDIDDAEAWAEKEFDILYMKLEKIDPDIDEENCYFDLGQVIYGDEIYD